MMCFQTVFICMEVNFTYTSALIEFVRQKLIQLKSFSTFRTVIMWFGDHFI